MANACFLRNACYLAEATKYLKMRNVAQLSIPFFISFFLGSCTDKLPKITPLGNFSTDCETQDGYGGELFIEAFEMEGRALYDVEWYFDNLEDGPTISARHGILSRDFMVFGHPKGEVFVQLWRSEDFQSQNPSGYEAVFIYVNRADQSARVINARCEEGNGGNLRR